MTSAGRRVNQSTLNGHGANRCRCGQPQPQHRITRRPPELLKDGLSTAGWSAVAACTVGSGSVLCPEGFNQTLLKITATSANTNLFWDLTLPNAGTNAGRAGIEFDLYVEYDSFATLGNTTGYMTLFFRDAGGSNTLASTFQVVQGWQRIRLSATDFDTPAGTGSWTGTTFTSLRWKITGRASWTPVCYIRNLCWAGWDKPVFSIVHDDGGISGYTTVFPLLQARQMVASFAVIGSAIGIVFGGYDHIDASEMREMRRAGCEFLNHTHTHQQSVLPTATQADCLTEINNCRAAIVATGADNGQGEYIFCSPYGEWGTNYWAASDQAGNQVFRGTAFSDGSIKPMGTSSAIVQGNRQVGCLSTISTTATSYIASVIDYTIAKGGQLILLYHHILGSSGASIETTTAKYTAILDYLRAKRDAGLCDVVTM